MAEIQKYIVKRGKRNAIFRRFHVKDDKKTIASWGLELGKIRSVFDIELAPGKDASGAECGPLDARAAATGLSDTGIAAPTNHRNATKDHEDPYRQNRPAHASVPEEHPQPSLRGATRTVPDVHRDVVKTHTIVSEVKRDVADTHTMVTEIHRNMLKNRGDDNGENQTAPQQSKPNSHLDCPVEISSSHTVTPRSSVCAVVHWSIRVFYQAADGAILRSEFNGRWTHFRHQPLVGAVLSTPLACVTWKAEKEIRLFYLDSRHILQEYRYSEGVGWFAGEVGMMDIKVSVKSRISAIYLSDERGYMRFRVYYQEPGSQSIMEMCNDGNWTKGRSLQLSGVLAGTSIAAVAFDWNGGTSIRIYYQAEDLSLRDYCYESGRGWYPGDWNPGNAPRGCPIDAMAFTLDGSLQLQVYWRNHQDEIVVNKHAGSWGPVTKVVGGVASDLPFALVHWVDGNYIRVYYQNNAGVVLEHCSDDRGENWCPGYKWGIARLAQCSGTA